jgi:hypothetical protein
MKKHKQQWLHVLTSKQYTVLLAVVAVLLIGLAVFMWKAEYGPFSRDASSATTLDPLTASPEEVAHLFVEAFLLSAPPKFDAVAEQSAQSLLSERVKGNQLPELLGVQDIPDQGFIIGDTIYREDPDTQDPQGIAIVPVELLYSGGSVERWVVMRKFQSAWQIEGVSVSKPDEM